MVPPPVSVAIKETVCPLHKGFEPIVIAVVTTGFTGAITVMVIAEEVSLAGTAHTALLDKMQVTTSPSAKAALLKVAPVAALLPFTSHW